MGISFWEVGMVYSHTLLYFLQNHKKGKNILPESIANTTKTGIERISPSARSGSLTVEAAMVAPLFLFFCISLISVMDMLRIYMHTEMKLYSAARDLAVASAGAGEDDMIRLSLVYPVTSMGTPRYFQKMLVLENHVAVHAFNGYSGNDLSWNRGEEEYVYVTQDSEVYHRQRSCKHLNVSVTAVTRDNVSKERNLDGSKYRACPYCKKVFPNSDGNNVYITDYGNRYHTMADCPDLKRSVTRIPISQTGGRRPCRDCG